MKRYKVRVLPAAQRNVREILRFLAALSVDTARLYQGLFAAGFRSLTETPMRCPPARDAYMAERGYRFLLVRNYLVFFLVSGDTVQITHIIDGRSDYL